ncbi:MAG: flagellar M-ring protein FliF [Deltaproteobacteria bacterium]|nr:flagellar M-ring protein FliF [Deltaproteobacteria bacterium]
MNELTQLWTRARERWNALPMMQRVGALVAIAVLVAGSLLYQAQRTGPEMEVLYAGLDEADAAEIVERLRAQHVAYEIGPDGTTLRVPASAVHETRLSLAAEGLPVGSGVGFEIFDTQRFGESEFVEQVQYLRALEGELSRTIGALDGVESARVHLVLPERTLLGGRGRTARASIVVAMRGVRRLREDQVRGIVHLVAGSVRDLDAENVTVVDGEGRPLSSSEGQEDASAAGDAESLRERVERSRERAIQDMLDQTIGDGASVVRLSAEVSFTREEHLEERYDPEHTATRSFELTTEGPDADATGTTAGIAGAVSALPGGPGPEQTTTPVGAGGRRSEVRNFEVTKTVHRAVEPVGRVTRLSVAVLIDGRWEGEGDARHFVPRTEDEIARIRSVVSSAAGIREDRGDTLSIECVPFVSPPASEGAEATAATSVLTASPVVIGSVAAGVLLVTALGAWLLVRRRRARRLAAEKAALAIAEPVAASDASKSDGTKSEGLTALASAEPEEPESVRVRVIDFARREPELAARVVRAWLAAEASTDAPAVTAGTESSEEARAA